MRGTNPQLNTSEKVIPPRVFNDIVEEYLDWGRTQVGRNNQPWSKIHLQNKKTRLAWWGNELELQHVGDLNNRLSDVEKGVRKLLDEPKAPKTVRDYAEALQSFAEWCRVRKYLLENPLRDLKLVANTPREERRPLTIEEVHSLLNASPPERALLYETAILTGLRANELASLTRAHLDSDNCTLRLDKAWTKNKKDGLLSIPEALAARLAASVADKPNAAALLCIHVHASRTLAKDLKKAGIPKITAEGIIVFHSLRHTAATLIVVAGASPKEAQVLARHSTPNLTIQTYTHARGERLAHLTDQVAQRIFGK